MKWYLITSAPKYAISEDGETIINIHTKKELTHNSTTVNKDKKRRVTLYYKTLFMGKYRSRRKVYPVDLLKDYIKPENLLTNINI